eukprot:jgi/Chrzof1/9595/Cz04g09030.t1
MLVMCFMCRSSCGRSITLLFGLVMPDSHQPSCQQHANCKLAWKFMCVSCPGGGELLFGLIIKSTSSPDDIGLTDVRLIWIIWCN